MTSSELNKWQRGQMRAYALSFRKANPVPSVLCVLWNAIVHRELSFPERAAHVRLSNVKRDFDKAVKRAGL